MSEVTPTAVETIAASSDKAVDAVADTVQAGAKSVKDAARPAPAARRARSAAKRAPAAAKSATAKRSAKPRAAAPVAQTARKDAAPVAKRKYVRKAVAATKSAASPSPKVTATNSTPQGIKIMDNANNMFAAFTSLPGADRFQNLFAGAGDKSQDVVRKGQAFAETLTETTRANLEAVAEASRIAAAGARDLGHEVVASTKGGVEQATAAVKTLAEAKSPTEFFQLQSELVRASFDRFVAEGSKLTEQMVKLAGEAAQPLSSRASVNAEKFSELTA